MDRIEAKGTKRAWAAAWVTAVAALATACAAQPATSADFQPPPADTPVHTDMALGGAGGTEVKSCTATTTGGEWVCKTTSGATVCCSYCYGTSCGSCVPCD